MLFRRRPAGPTHGDLLACIHDLKETLMSTVDQLASDFTKYQADVTTALSELKTELATALAAQGGVPADVQAKLDALDSAVTAADTSLTAPAAPASGTGSA